MDKSGNIQFSMADGVCILRLAGRVTYLQGPAFNTFVESLSQESSLQSLAVDLRPTLYVDSTILGILAKLSILAQKRWNSRLLMISPNEDINMILRSSGLDDVFIIICQIPPQEDWRDIPSASPDTQLQAETILEAHRALMNLSDENRLRFRDVVDLMDKEIHPQG